MMKMIPIRRQSPPNNLIRHILNLSIPLTGHTRQIALCNLNHYAKMIHYFIVQKRILHRNVQWTFLGFHSSWDFGIFDCSNFVVTMHCVFC
jgi:hypothetical protein